MPPLTFHPEYERHLTYTSLGHCPRHYSYARQAAHGLIPEPLAGASLLIGIGMDIAVSGWWSGQRVYELLLERVRDGLQREKTLPEVKLEAVFEEVRSGLLQYIAQWEGVRQWEIVSVHPYEDEQQLPKWVWGGSYLCMPDMVARIDDVLTIVDFKTGRWAYEPEAFAYDPQMLTYCLQAKQVYLGETIQFLIDYMQRPTRKSGTWCFPVTYPFLFDGKSEMLAISWLRNANDRKDYYQELADDCEHMHTDVEAWPRDPAQCRTWYGRCEWYQRCFGEEGDGGG